MGRENLNTLETFTIESLPNLDTVVLGALELFSSTPLPDLGTIPFKRPLVVGSVGAHVTGQIVFNTKPAVFADENNYQVKMQLPDIDGAVLLSASGGKHAIAIAEALKQRNIETYLVTNTPDAPASQFIPTEHVLVFPKNREPYTYNTSTYLGMILAATHEQPEAIYSFIADELAPSIPQNFGSYHAYVLVIPPQFALLRELLETKFDELFGPRITGRVFTTEEIEHAKTVVHSDDELFITFGVDIPSELLQGSTHIALPTPPSTGYGGMMAVSYFVVGNIQRQHPPYFKDAVVSYAQTASKVFGHEIKPIVE